MDTCSATSKLVCSAWLCLLVTRVLPVVAQVPDPGLARAASSLGRLTRQLQAVEAPKLSELLQPRSLALGSAGRPHIGHRHQYSGCPMVAALVEEPPTPSPTATASRTATPTHTPTATPS